MDYCSQRFGTTAISDSSEGASEDKAAQVELHLGEHRSPARELQSVHLRFRSRRCLVVPTRGDTDQLGDGSPLNPSELSAANIASRIVSHFLGAAMTVDRIVDVALARKTPKTLRTPCSVGF